MPPTPTAFQSDLLAATAIAISTSNDESIGTTYDVCGRLASHCYRFAIGETL